MIETSWMVKCPFMLGPTWKDVLFCWDEKDEVPSVARSFRTQLHGGMKLSRCPFYGDIGELPIYYGGDNACIKSSPKAKL